MGGGDIPWIPTEEKPSWMEASNIMPGTHLVINKLWLELKFSVGSLLSVVRHGRTKTWRNLPLPEIGHWLLELRSFKDGKPGWCPPCRTGSHQHVTEFTLPSVPLQSPWVRDNVWDRQIPPNGSGSGNPFSGIKTMWTIYRMCPKECLLLSPVNEDWRALAKLG